MVAQLISLLLSLAFFLIGLFTLSDFGINWDAPIRMLRGQAYAHIFLTGKQSYGYPDRLSPILIEAGEHATRLNFVAGEYGKYVELSERPLPRLEFENAQEILGKRFSFYQHEAWNGTQFINDDAAHLPLIDILSAFSNRFFYQSLGVLGDIESYPLIYIVISALGVFIVTIFTFQITNSLFAAFIAGISLFLFPPFFAESHFNGKDPIQASFYAGTVWAFWNWVKRNKLGWWVVFGGFVALSLGVKWNIIFLPFILIPWLFLIRKTGEFIKWFKIKKLTFLALLFLIFTFSFLLFIWPYAWADPIGRILSVFSYYAGVGIVKETYLQPDRFIGPLGVNFYPLLLFLTQTPEIVLILAGIGVVWAIRLKGGKLKVGYLLLLWLLIPMIRQSLPNMWFFNGLRQVMEIIPAMAILTGIGAGYISSKFKVQTAKWIITGSVFIILLVPIIYLHPNQNAYFNIFVGGFKGAVEKNLVDWWFNYGNIYKQAALWLNQNAQKDVNLALIDGSMFALSPLWLRGDISISPNHFSGFEQRGEYILIPYNLFNPPIFAYRYPQVFLKPLHAISIDEIPVLTIYKNDLVHTKTDFGKEQAITDFKTGIGKSEKGNFIEIDLGEDLAITRITLENTPARCQIINYQVIDEFLEFISSTTETYGLLEKSSLGKGQIEFYIPGQKARSIRIYPQGFSCFIQGKVSKIYHLRQ